MTEFTVVDRTKLQKAFALAHQAFEYGGYPEATRRKFKAIADLLWQAHGEKGSTPPVGVGKALIARIPLTKGGK